MIRQVSQEVSAAKLLRIPDAAKVLQVSRAHVYALMERGELPYTKLGRARRIPVSAIDDLIATQTTRELVAVGAGVGGN